MREKILLGGGTNTGKTKALIQLALLYPDRWVRIFDAEGDVALTLEAMGFPPLPSQEGVTHLTFDGLPNIQVFEVRPDWKLLEAKYLEWHDQMRPIDWMGFDMMGVFWDLAQNYYSKSVFGQSPALHIIKLRQEAQKANFNGFDGLTEWPVIKRMHNEDIFDDALRWSNFNVLATTSLVDYSPKEKVPLTDDAPGLIAKYYGKKLEGEKHNDYRFRTIAILVNRTLGNPPARKFLFRLVKVKDEPIVEPIPEHDFTDMTFFQKYAQVRGYQL